MFPIRDHQPSPVFPFVTIGLIGLNILGFVLEFSAPDVEAFIMNWALVPADLSFSAPASWMRIFTAAFLHAGFAHIGFNMWYLWIFGDNVEGRLGHVPFLLFYFLAALAAALAQLFFTPDSTIPMLGASGAVAGVLGAYLSFFPHHKIDTILPGMYRSTVPAGIVLVFWFVTQLLNGSASILSTDTAASGGTAWWAHIGGFAFGWIAAKLFATTTSNSRPS